jgi:hypothetical protein
VIVVLAYALAKVKASERQSTFKGMAAALEEIPPAATISTIGATARRWFASGDPECGKEFAVLLDAALD